MHFSHPWFSHTTKTYTYASFILRGLLSKERLTCRDDLNIFLVTFACHFETIVNVLMKIFKITITLIGGKQQKNTI